MTDRALTDKQERFARAYTGEARGNGVRAAGFAGYQGNARNLHANAGRNLANPRVAAFIAGLTAEFNATQRAVLEETCDIAFAEWGEFVEVITKNGIPVHHKLDLTNKVKALELLAKTQGMLTDKVRVEGLPKAIIGIDLEDV